MFEGLLVDLVPWSKAFEEREPQWRNSEAQFWASGGDRSFWTKAMLERQYAEWAEGRERGWTGISFGVQTKDGTPIGSFGINFIIPFSRLAMLGAKIGEKDYWGGGYGTDALLLIIDYAFDWLDMRKIWLGTTDYNARVKRQMEKVGFRLEGVQRNESLMDGVWYDGLLYGMLRNEWPGRAVMIERLGLKANAE